MRSLAKPCKIAMGVPNRDGYKYRKINGRRVGVHRLAWIVYKGTIPTGLQVLHHCDNPPCIEITHLFLGTHDDNMADKRAKGRGRTIPRPGMFNPMVKLTDEEVDEVRTRYAAGGVLQRELAEEYGVSKNHIGRLIRNEQRGRLT